MNTAVYYSKIDHDNVSWLDHQRIKAAIKHIYGLSVLDIGCSSGTFMSYVHKNGNNLRLVGMDINSTRAAEAQRYGEIFIGDIEEQLPFDDREFTTVACLEVLEHLEQPFTAILEFSRVCDHRLIISVPYCEKIKQLLCRHCGNETPYSGHLWTFNQSDIKAMIPPEFQVVHSELIGAIRPVKYKRIPKTPFAIRYLAPMTPPRWLLTVADRKGKL